MQTLPDGGPYRIFWRSGSNGEWTWSDTSTTGILDNGTNIYYNQWTGATWQQTAITSNSRWVNHFVFALPEHSGAKRTCVFMGQVLHTTLAAAQAEDPATSLTGYEALTEEIVFLYRMTYERKAATLSNAILASVQGTRSNTISVTGGFSSSDHQTLSNRGATGAHPAAAVSVDTAGFSGSLLGVSPDVQSALAKLDTAVGGGYADYNFTVGSGGQSAFVTGSFTVTSRINVMVNGQMLPLEGADKDWTRDAGTSTVTINETQPQYAQVTIRIYP